MNTYQELDFTSYDPIIRHFMKTKLPIDWKYTIENTADDEGIEVVEAAADYRLKAGITIPIFGDNNLTGGISFAADKCSEFYQTIESKYDLLLAATLILHNYLQENHKNEDCKPISNQQLSCLTWLLEGYSSKQIADKMNIQEDTVNKHIQSAKEKLGAKPNRIDCESY